MTVRLVAKNDCTSTGGWVMDGSSTFYNEQGESYALAEDQATCGNCKGLWPIGGTARDCMEDGRAMVKDLDHVYCPCGKNRVFASSESSFFWSEGGAQSETVQPITPAKVYDEQFILRDANGAILADTYYTIDLQGALAHGVTDSQGRTERYSTDGVHVIRLYIGHQLED